MSASSRPTHFPSEFGIILSCLDRIRRRLWTVRLIERITLAILYCAPVALVFLAARLILERYPLPAVLLTALPLLPLAWLLIPALRRRGPAWLSGLRQLSTTFLSVAAALTVLVLALYVSPYWHHLAIWMIPAVSAGVFILAAALTSPRLSTRSVAIFVDQQAGLREKVSTALEWADRAALSPAEAAFQQPLVASAVTACQQVQVARVGYGRLDRRAYALATACLAAGSMLAMLHPLPALALARSRPNPQVLQQTADLVKILSELEKDKPNPLDPKADQALAPLKRVVSEFRKNGNMSNLEAMSKLSEAHNEMEKTAERQTANEAAHEALESSQTTRDLAAAADKMKAAEMKAASGDAGAQAQREAAAQALGDAAKAAGDKLAAGQLGDKDKKDLAGALNNAAAKAGGDKQLQQSLQGAAKACQGGDGKSLTQNLSDAGNRMGQQMSEHALSGEQLKEAMQATDAAAGGLGGEQAMHDQATGGQSGDQGSSGGQQGGEGSQGGEQANSGGGQQGGQGGSQGGEGNQANGGAGSNPGDGSQNTPSGGQAGQGGYSRPAGTGNGANGANANSGQRSPEDSGSTSLEQRGSPGQYHGTEVHGDKTFVKVYSTRETANAGDTHRATANISKGPSAGTMDVLGPGDKDDAVLTYESQLPAARKLAQEAIDKQQIPPQYRDLIRSYYEK